MYEFLGSENISAVLKEESEIVNWNGKLSFVKNTADLDRLEREKKKENFKKKADYRKWMVNNYENTYK